MGRFCRMRNHGGSLERGGDIVMGHRCIKNVLDATQCDFNPEEC